MAFSAAKGGESHIRSYPEAAPAQAGVCSVLPGGSAVKK